MRFGALPTLQAVLRRGSFALAAEELGLTPSAVSQQMRNLEEYFGQPLFDRSGRTVKPTPLALEVVAIVRDPFSALGLLRDRSGRDLRGKLRFGATNTVQLSVLPRALRLQMERYPSIQIQLEPEHISEHLLDMVKAGNIDAAAIAKPEGAVARNLVYEEIASEAFVLVYPQSYTGAATMRDIMAHLPWIRYNAKLSGGKMASAFVRQVFPGLEARYEVMSGEAVMNMVSEGLGFSVIPQPRELLARMYPVNMLRLDRKMRKRQIVLARRIVDADNRRINALLECLRDAFAQAYS